MAGDLERALGRLEAGQAELLRLTSSLHEDLSDHKKTTDERISSLERFHWKQAGVYGFVVVMGTVAGALVIEIAKAAIVH